MNPLYNEIDELVKQRAEFRRLSQWSQADAIKQRLLLVYNVEIVDYSDRSSEWKTLKSSKEEYFQLTWSPFVSSAVSTVASSSVVVPDRIPLVVVTVDSPHYRERLRDTTDSLDRWQNISSCHKKFIPEPCDLLKLKDFPSVGVKGILMEGWRRILLPRLMSQTYATGSAPLFVMVAEDDIRFPSHLKPETIYRLCEQAFRLDPNVSLLSLGHAWTDLCKQEHNLKTTTACSLIEHLQTRQKNVHATTLLALRWTHLSKVQNALQQVKRPTHLDQYLFHSTQHDLSVALCSPPMAGWAEVTETLTVSGSGHRRRGGGRIGFVPSCTAGDKVEWCKRNRVAVVAAVSSKESQQQGLA